MMAGLAGSRQVFVVRPEILGPVVALAPAVVREVAALVLGAVAIAQSLERHSKEDKSRLALLHHHAANVVEWGAVMGQVEHLAEAEEDRMTLAATVACPIGSSLSRTST